MISLRRMTQNKLKQNNHHSAVEPYLSKPGLNLDLDNPRSVRS